MLNTMLNSINTTNSFSNNQGINPNTNTTTSSMNTN